MFYSFFRIIFLFVFKLFFRLKVEGLENLPEKSNFIIVANHASFLDPFILGAAIPRKIYWIILKSICGGFLLGWFTKMIGGVLPTGSSSQKAIFLLEKNKNIGMFPEGTRTYDGKLREFRRGAALLAIKTGRPIVPAAIIGAYEALPRTRWLLRLSAIKVKIGKPKYLLKEFDEVVDDIYLQRGIFEIRNDIQEMLNAK